MPTMKLDIITAEHRVYSEDVEMLLAPGVDGQLGILPHHAPLMTVLQPGELVIRKDGQDSFLAVSGGFLEVMGNVVTVLADAAERSEEIDVERARAAMQRAEERLKTRATDIDLERAMKAYQRAQVRLRVAQRARRGGPPRGAPPGPGA